jgi:lipid A 3-O-deacylase
MRKSLLFLSCSLSMLIAGAQNVSRETYAKEISFTTENDAYLFQSKDAYYTNGVFFAFRTAQEKKGRKLIQGLELGQMIFTPLIRKTEGPSDIDRPYCGYLFLQYNQTRFTGNHSVLQLKVTAGAVGNASLGEDLQNGYHKLLGYGRFSGWQYQVQNAFGIDLGASFAHTIWEDSSWIKIMPVVQANLGMNFTNAKIGTYFCFGSFENNSNSALWNARVQAKDNPTRKKHELYLYWYPQLIKQFYNATVSGGVFQSKGENEVIGDIEPWMFQQNIGVCYAAARWTTSLEYIYQSTEALAQKRAQQYASVRVSYRLH